MVGKIRFLGEKGLESKNTSILLVEDTVALARTYEAYLKDSPYDILSVETGKEGMAAIDENPPEIILLDLVLPDMDGLEILKRISKEEIPSAVIVVTANASLNTAIEAMRLGAMDFLVKPFNAERLKVTIKNVIERQHLNKIVETYRNDLDRREYGGFIGPSLPMQSVYRIIDSVANSKATVFITGESGTGKEVCAEAIHNKSPRGKGPLVTLNCGAIPKDLMESEVFGHVKGAFTGAVADRDGAASMAGGGTLFLDEICEMDINLQTKLLRFIQTGTFQKVGSSTTEQTDIRFICATNKDPLVEVAEGRFREDLFYRLHVVPIEMPPLRDRDFDVLAIADVLLEAYASEEGKSFTGFSDEVRGILAVYPWPGNVRQLQNVIRNMVVLNDGEEITLAMLPAPLDEFIGKASPISSTDRVNVIHNTNNGIITSPSKSTPSSEADIRPLDESERETIERAIDICDGNVPKAAAKLGISASTIYRKRQAWEEKQKKMA
ncbi:MAG: sigma-54-dependent Fis family transcriptional regulator [Rhodospirillaceae bacterium]|nr:sigma-54-dependent Fis family transcriptional regulator [Rhodospirillaceae bacterium]